MLILVLFLSIVVLGAGIYFYRLSKIYYDDRYSLEKENKRLYRKCHFFYVNDWIHRLQISIGVIFLAITLISLIVVGCNYSGIINVDDKIALYELENINIEEQISVVVENYKGWESETYNAFKNESPTVLISLFPELKSNELVGKQIEIYVANNQKIKELKELKLDYKIYGWWLYFAD